MEKVRSRDGTAIAFERLGEGRPVIVVCGAMCDRALMRPTAEELAKHFAVFNYDRLQVHPRGRLEAPLTGVFATRSPDRPNPVGLHRVSVLEVDGQRLRVTPMEAIDGTPVVDIKPVLARSDER